MRLRPLPASMALALCILLAGGAARAGGFSGVFSRDGIDAWAVGDSGFVYRTLNGGATWSSRSLGATGLRGVAASGLNVLVVGDSGKVWRSSDSGGNWSLAVLAGEPDLRALEMVSDQVGYAVGAAGVILRTDDGGATWSPQTSGTAAALSSVRFSGPDSGWAVGEGGVALGTVDGGSTWTPASLGTSRDLYSVAVRGPVIWVAGAKATAYQSEDGGVQWDAVDLDLDYGPDVTAAWIQPSGRVFLGGGSGFIRSSADGGASWEFAVHPMQAAISYLFFFDENRGWAVSSANRIVLTTSDGGVNWTMPVGAAASRSWVRNLPFIGSARGKSVDVNLQNPSIFYAALGNQVYRSPDEGETWQSFATIPQALKVNAFLVSPKDTNVFVAAVSGVIAQRLIKSDDAGQSWFTTLTHAYGEYGIPVERDADHPDTLMFGGDSDGIYRSTDGGKNWSRWSVNSFRSPCDIVIVPDSTDIVLVGDGITGSGQGQYYKSTDAGENFTLAATRPIGCSEIPGMATSRLRNSDTFGTNWGAGGVQRTTNYGDTWPNVHNAGAAWGVDVSKDDPNLVIFGQYSGGQTYISFDGGNSFTNIPIVGSNYSLFARDRSVIVAEQSAGMYKLYATYTYPPFNTQSVTVLAPNGGEIWPAGTVHDITWDSQNVALARIEYRPGPADPWQLVAEVLGYSGSYSWTTPYDATDQAQVRVVDAWDLSPADTSDQDFTIALPMIAETPDPLDFAMKPIGSSWSIPVTIQDTGTGILNVTSVTTVDGTYFHPNRTSFAVGPGGSDTLGVTFEPTMVGTFVDTLVIQSTAYDEPELRVGLVGTAYDTVGVTIAVTAPLGGEEWRYGTVHDVAWNSANVPEVTVEYQTDPLGAWKSIVPSVPAGSSPYGWTIPFDTTSHARVRVRDAYGTQFGINPAEFRITSPILVEDPSLIEFYLTLVGSMRQDEMRIDNPGSAPLTISSLTSDNPDFWPGRSSLTIPIGGSDTVGVYFQPSADGADSALFTIVGDDPASPHTVTVRGSATSSVAVGDQPALASFALRQNEPNPFSGATLIRFSLPAEAEVDLEVFNLQGQRVATLIRGRRGPGEHSVRFGPGAPSASGQRIGALPSGVYFYRFRAGPFTSTRKMLLLR